MPIFHALFFRRPSPFLAIVALFAVFCTGGRSMAQNIIYVRASAPSGGDGQSWGTAFNDLQQGLSLARTLGPIGDVSVWIAEGRYLPADPSSPFSTLEASTFSLPENVSILGGFAGTETSALQRVIADHPTVLDGSFRSDTRALNVVRVDIAGSVVLDGCIISTEGFTFFTPNAELAAVVRGTATFRNCTFVTSTGVNPEGGLAGAASVRNATARFESCRFLGAQGAGAGGVYISDTQAPADTSAEFVSCLFSGTRSTDTNAADCTTNFVGAAVTADNVPAGVTFRNCSFVGNIGASVCSKQIGARAAPLRIYNCLFAQGGAGVVTSARAVSSSLEVRGCIAPAGSFAGSPLTVSDLLTTDPLLVDTDGPDNIAGTRDDDPVPGPGSPAIDSGDAAFIVPGMVTDATGRRRLHDGNGDGSRLIDRGAAEAGSPLYTPVLYVRQSATGGNNGGSWADAFSGTLGLQNAMALIDTSPGQFSEIWVASGVYKPTVTGDRNASFAPRRAVRLLGGFAGNETSAPQRDPLVNISTLSGDLQGDDAGGLNIRDNSRHVVEINQGGERVYLDGFTITGGNADGVGAAGQGGGLFQVDGNPVEIRRCTFLNNRASEYGGGAMLTINAQVFDCVFRGNSAQEGGAIGRVFIQNSPFTPLVRRTHFESNAAQSGGAVTFGTYADCTFVRNTATTNGGAIGPGRDGFGSTRVFSCQFLGNVAGVDGGANSEAGTNAGCLFVGNRAGRHGGALSKLTTTHNCTIVANTALTGQGGGLAVTGSGGVTRLNNNIFWGNTAASGTTEVQQVSTTVPGGFLLLGGSLIQGWTGTLYQNAPSALVSGANPQFLRMPSPGADLVWGTTDDDYGDLRIASGSPAIDSGFNQSVPTDLSDLDEDSDVVEPLPLDLARLPRFVDDPTVIDGGGGTAPIIDRGCYEYQPGCPSCLGVREWLSPTGGLFASAYNWTISLPDASHDTLYGVPGTYTVTFPAPSGSTITNRSATIRSGAVNFALGGDTLRLTRNDQTALIVADTPGLTPSLTISNGTVRAPSVQIGQLAGSTGVLNVAGSTSRLIAAEESLSVGFLGTGTMNITGGGQVTSRFAYVGDQPGGLGTVLIDGPGSRWTVPFSLTVNNGHVTVRNGGVLATSFGLFLGQDASLDGDGTINGPVINFGRINPGNSPGTLTINGDFSQVGEILDLGSASGSTTIQVNGTTPGTFDRVIINGRATLGGGLFVEAPPAGFPEIPPGGLSLPIIDVLGGFPTATPERFDVAYFPRIPGAGGGPSDKFLKLVQPEGGGGQFFNLTTGGLGQPIVIGNPDNQEATAAPSSIAAADLNGDGLADLLITTPADDSIAVLMNLGTVGGEWQGFQGPVLFAVGSNPQGVSVRDINGDGRQDLAVVNQASNSVTLLQNNTTPGSAIANFANQGALSVGQGPTGVDVNFFDGSGTIPVVITADEGDGTLSILVRTSGPGFNFQPRTIKPVPTATPPRQPRCLDIDGDGARPDIALLSTGGSSVLIYQNISVGLGIVAFADPEPIAVGTAPVDLQVGTFKGGRASLVTANPSEGTLSLLINKSTIEDPTAFAPAVDVPAGDEPISVATLDIEGDGDSDIAVLTSINGEFQVQVLRNDSVVGAIEENPQATFVPDSTLSDPLAPSDPFFVLAAPLASVTVTDLLTVGDQGGQRGPGGAMLQNVRPRLNATMGGGVNTCFIDFNNDGIVSPDDLDEFITTYFSEPPDNMNADFNDDGIVSPDDLDEFITAYFEGC